MPFATPLPRFVLKYYSKNNLGIFWKDLSKSYFDEDFDVDLIRSAYERPASHVNSFTGRLTREHEAKRDT